MHTQYLQIAGLLYSVSSQVRLADNYSPFFVVPDENAPLASTVTVGNLPVISEKVLCHKGLVIDDTKELYIYKVQGKEGGYYISVKTKGEDTAYELYASLTWDHVIFSNKCISTECHYSVIDIFMMLTFIYSAASYNTVLLHSSCVKCGEDAVAFIGQSGAGKSTHSRLWLTYIPDTQLLNDDQPAVQVNESGDVEIFGTPWSGKTPCYISDKGCLKGIVRMKQALINRITALSPVALFQELLSSCSMIKEDPQTFKLITSTLSKIASKISGFILENRPEKEAAMMTYTNTIMKNNTLVNKNV